MALEGGGANLLVLVIAIALLVFVAAATGPPGHVPVLEQRVDADGKRSIDSAISAQETLRLRAFVTA